MKKNNSRFNGLCSVLIIYFLIMTPFFVSCGSSGGGGNDTQQNDNAQPEIDLIEWDPSEVEAGTVSYNPDTEVTLYESAEVEIIQGVIFKKSMVLVPIESESDVTEHKALSVLKFRNTSDSEKRISFLTEIPANFAQDLNNLKFKLITGESDVNLLESINITDDFVSFSDFVNAGHIELMQDVNNTSSIHNALFSTGFYVVVSIILAVFATQHVLIVTDKSSVFNVPPVHLASQLPKTKGEMLTWINSWLNKFCETIKKSAKTNNIPPRLLATVILNELADWDGWDQTQMLTRERDKGSYGWPQLQISRVLEEHNLIEIGPKDKIRDPKIDIAEEDLPWYKTRDMGIKGLLWDRLVNPETSIEIAAREIAYILDRFKEGSPVLNNAWAKALLENPEKGIDKNNIYANLKTLSINADPVEKQKNLEESLAILVVGPYNTPPLIDKNDPKDIQLDNGSPWEQPLNKEVNYYNARQHAANIRTYDISKFVYEWLCLKDNIPDVPKLKSFSMSETISKIWDGNIFEKETESISGPSDDIMGYRPSPGTVIFEVSGNTVCEKIVSYAHKIEHLDDSSFREFIGKPQCKDNSDLYITIVDYNTSSPSITLSFDFYGSYKWSDNTVWNDTITTYNLKHSPQKKDVVIKGNVYTATINENEGVKYGDHVTGTISITVEFPAVN